MDNMLEHPGSELQALIKEKGLTQKAFASILGKKVSEVNELLKGKRNITIQRDYLLHQTLGTPIKYWILKQVDYDYSLLDIDESDDLSSGATAKDLGGEMDEQNTQDSSSQTPQNDDIAQARHSEPERRENPSNITPMDFSLQSKGQTDTQKPPVQEPEIKDNEDLKNRADIFRTF